MGFLPIFNTLVYDCQKQYAEKEKHTEISERKMEILFYFFIFVSVEKGESKYFKS